MKFTKEQAIESITSKFADKAKGIDLKRTIEEAVSNCMEMVGENSEMELDAFVGFVEKNVSSALGFAKHLKKTATESMQEQLAELQRKLDGKEPPKTDDDDKPIKTDDPALKAMQDEIAEMKKKLAAKDAEEAVTEKRKQLVAKMGESIKDKDWIDDYLKEIQITAETDVEQKAKDFIAFYNKTQSKGGRTTPKQTGGDDDGVDSNVKSVVAAAAQIKKSMGHGPVTSTTTNNNNN